jgi:hypothetical protein
MGNRPPLAISMSFVFEFFTGYDGAVTVKVTFTASGKAYFW